MDLIWTLVVVYLAYRGYKWYQTLQSQVKGADRPPRMDLDEEVPAAHPRPGDEDDYIEYEELKEE